MAKFVPAWLGKALGTRTRELRPAWLDTSLEKRAIELSQVGKKATPTFESPSGPTVEQIAMGIIEREGGFVNDPDDPGGATNFGVTIGTMRTLGIDLNEDGKIDEADVKLMTAEKAQKIFIKEFFSKPGIDSLPTELQATVFDMQVNSGSNAIKILQRVTNLFGGRELDRGDALGSLVVDGVLGPNTLKAVSAVYREMGSEFVNEYGIARRDYYYSLADGREQSRKFARTKNGGKGGWIKRAEEFLPQNLHLTDEEHTERVASWG